MSKQSLVKSEEIPELTHPGQVDGDTTVQVQPQTYDPPPQYPGHAQLQSYPPYLEQPYTQQPPTYHPYPGQAYVDPSTQHIIVPVAPTPVSGVADYLVHNILVLVFCCLPIGIIGIIKSSECRSAIAVGDTRKAEQLSSEAKKLAIMGCGCGSILFVGLTVFYVVLYSSLGMV